MQLTIRYRVIYQNDVMNLELPGERAIVFTASVMTVPHLYVKEKTSHVLHQ